MYKITETFKDYNGVSRTEDFYFNLNTDELAKLQLSEYGGLDEMLKVIIQKKDVPKMIKIFELIIDKSYGVRSADGRNFYKEEQKPGILADFKSTIAYSQIFTRFATNSEFTSEFIKGIIPEDASELLSEKETKDKIVDIKPVV